MSSIARYLPWISGLVLIAGVVAFAVVKLSDNGSSTKSTTVASSSSQPTKAKAATKPAAKPIAPATHNRKQQQAAAAKFDASARQVAGKFILTAVARKHLAQAWPLAGPAIREDSTYKEWLTGNIAVVPYLDRLAGAKFSVQSLGRNQVSIGVALIPKSTKKKAQFFDMTLIKVGRGANRHWVVNYWVPRGGFAVPNTPNG